MAKDSGQKVEVFNPVNQRVCEMPDMPGNNKNIWIGCKRNSPKPYIHCLLCNKYDIF